MFRASINWLVLLWSGCSRSAREPKATHIDEIEGARGGVSKPVGRTLGARSAMWSRPARRRP